MAEANAGLTLGARTVCACAVSAEPGMDDHDWALTEPVEATDVVIRSEVIDTTDPWYKGEEWAKYHQTGTEWTLTNGKINRENLH